MRQKLLVTFNLPELKPEYLEFLEAAGDLDISFVARKDLRREDVVDKDIIIGCIPPAFVASAKKLKLLQLNSAGYDAYIGSVPSSIHLCSATGAYSVAVGEHLLAMTFALIRHLPLYRDKQAKADWSDCGNIISVEDSTIAVIGLGDIGRSYAKKVKALGAACVIGVRRNVKDKPDYVDEIYSLDQLGTAIQRADIVVNILPSSPETVGLFNDATFAMMKDQAYFINVGRGSAVDQEALLWAVRSGKLAGAALDVCTPEPLPKESPLWSEPKILITPHVAGVFFLEETVHRIIQIAASNVKAFLEGRPLRNDIAH